MPIRFYATAKGYFQMVHLLLLVSPEGDSRRLMLLAPRSLLIGFALELYLKACLSHAGTSEGELRSKAFGHNIDRLYAEAVRFRLTDRDEYRILVKQFAARHADFGWRYMDGGSYSVTNFEYAMTLLDTLDNEVDALIGASASKGLSEGRKAPL